MATPLTGSCVAPAAIISSGSGDGGYAAATAFSGVSSALAYVKHSALKYPILAFLFFHKALRWELEKLHRDALALEKDCCGLHQIRALLHRYRFLRDIYKHHSNAEDEVIFPALDERVKNVALTYSLEHKGESDLFDQVFELLNSALKSNSSHHSFKLRRELICCTEAIQTSLCQHMGKEEEQVFPLLVEHFSFKEQAALVWQFMCSIPVNLMEEFLSWLVSSLSTDECQDMMRCMMKIVPEEPLLQQVVFTWLKGKNTCYDFENPLNEGNNERQTFKVSLLSNSAITVSSDHSSSRNECCEKNCKISNVVTSNHAIGNGNLLNQFPIDEIVYWHNAIRKEVKELAGEARHMQFSGDFSNLVAFNERLQFVADVCIFHSIAEDKLVFPAVDEKVRSEVCFINEHAQEENQFDDFRRLIDEKFHDKLCFGSSSGWSDFHDKLCSYADQIVQMIEKHFLNEEEEVLPLARKHCATDEQRHLLYQSLRVMPLRLLERVLPWLVKSLEEEEAKVMLQNMRLAAPASDMALVTLLSGWACKGRPRHNSNRWKYVCISSDSANDCPVKKINEISSRMNDDCDANITALDLKGTKHCLPELATEQARKRSKEDRGIFDKDSAETAPCSSGVSCSSQPCCVPGLGVSGSTLCAGTSSTGRNLRSLSFNSSAGASLSSNYSVGSDCGSYDNCQASKPIDLIFQFHKAIRKDLEHLDVESTKLMDCDEAFLRHFSGRFRLLWSLYTAHSNAEDEIVFPALESKESLHNVSHAYTLDHKQEEQLFNDISHVISDLVKLHEDSTTSASTGDWKVRHHELAAKLQRMCKSIRVTLDQHVFREELELWPLFDKHFTIEEQDKIIGRIIGTSGAEVLQSMLPWVTGALTQVEKNVMMDAWRQAARNTMFDEWLSAWWTDSSSLSSHSSSFTEQTNMSAAGTMPCENLEQRFQKFKPGWKDIFRMNQNELESAIRKVSSDTSLDPRQKAYLIQNLMTSRWIAAQQKLSQSKSLNESGSNEDLPGRCPSYRDSEQKVFGCEHYKRNCKLRAACCDQLFTCRFCHDKVSDHMMDRKATKEMMCMACLQLQPVAANCINPSCNGLTMAKYFCSICKLYDDEREIYHCPFCNLCRVGRGLGVDFFHCMTCNACMSKTLAVHRCREKGLESNCPICHDFLFTSSAPVKALPCGHFMHSSCFQAYTCSHYTCPICSKSLGDMAVYFGMLDALLSAEELPEEYRGRTQDILCNDCEQKGTAPFHWLYHKCGSCGSYNTRVI